MSSFESDGLVIFRSFFSSDEVTELREAAAGLRACTDESGWGCIIAAADRYPIPAPIHRLEALAASTLGEQASCGDLSYVRSEAFSPMRTCLWHVDKIPPNPPEASAIETFRIKFGIFLVDALGTTDGNFMYVPGGHQEVAARFADTPRRQWITPKRHSWFLFRRFRFLQLRVGDVFAFHPLMPHNISPNCRDVERRVIYAGYGKARYEFCG